MKYDLDTYNKALTRQSHAPRLPTLLDDPTPVYTVWIDGDEYAEPPDTCTTFAACADTLVAAQRHGVHGRRYAFSYAMATIMRRDYVADWGDYGYTPTYWTLIPINN